MNYLICVFWICTTGLKKIENKKRKKKFSYALCNFLMIASPFSVLNGTNSIGLVLLLNSCRRSSTKYSLFRYLTIGNALIFIHLVINWLCCSVLNFIQVVLWYFNAVSFLKCFFKHRNF